MELASEIVKRRCFYVQRCLYVLRCSYQSSLNLSANSSDERAALEQFWFDLLLFPSNDFLCDVLIAKAIDFFSEHLLPIVNLVCKDDERQLRRADLDHGLWGATANMRPGIPSWEEVINGIPAEATRLELSRR